MALLKYFTHVNSSSGTVLPNPESSLNRVVDQKAIEVANEEVTKIRSEGKGTKQQSPYVQICTELFTNVQSFTELKNIMYRVAHKFIECTKLY